MNRWMVPFLLSRRKMWLLPLVVLLTVLGKLLYVNRPETQPEPFIYTLY